jgi:hypothetical protein
MSGNDEALCTARAARKADEKRLQQWLDDAARGGNRFVVFWTRVDVPHDLPTFVDAFETRLGAEELVEKRTRAGLDSSVWKH